MIDPVVTDEAANDLNETRSRERWKDGKALRMEQAEELVMRALSNRNHSRNSDEQAVIEYVYDCMHGFSSPLIAEFFKAKYSPTISEENMLEMRDAQVRLFEKIEAYALEIAAEIVDARL